MRLKLEARAEPSPLMGYLSPLLAAGLTIIAGFILFSVLGKNPLQAFYTFFVHPIRDLNGIAELLLKASPLMLIAVGLACGYRANVWNIGAEGQLVLGAIFAGGVALYFYGSDSKFVLPMMVVAGAIGGMLWAAIPALLRTRFNTNEILVSLMLVYVANLLLSWLVNEPWRDPEGFNFPQTKQFTETALYPALIAGTRLNVGFLISLAAIAAGYLFLNRSFKGFQMRVAGLADAAAKYAGFNANGMIWLGLLLGGAAAGIAGMGEVAGPIGQLLPSVSPGYGFAAIIVAFVGRLHPVGILLASLLMSLLYLGGEAAQMELNLPSAMTGLFQGMLLFFLLGSDVFISYRVKVVQPPKAQARLKEAAA
ncbi:MAG: ABC transporter permease [Betaproteobacteria bacterium]|nr:ABC transporter permease [Betaproteobacteria bacterium]